MSKFLVTAAELVGAVALVATGIGAAAGAGLISVSAGTLATIHTVATVAALASGVIGFAAQMTAKKPTAGGNPVDWKADPDAGIDLVFGDAYNAGHIVYRQAYADAGKKKNKWQTLITVWSLGLVASIDTLYVDNVAKAVTNQIVAIDDRGKMLENRQLGHCPEASYLIAGGVVPHGWTPAHKLSGKAATCTTFYYDAKGDTTFTSIPNCGWRGKGLLCWDPRKDSTYPGGNGPQRRDDQSTWVWSNNPYVVGITYCIGWRQNGKLAGGVGLDLEGVLLDQFVEGANVADANGWRVGGVKSTTDDKWDTLKDILQAGGGEPVRLGAMLGCIVRAPRVSLATIDRDALADGEISVPAMTARRDRLNTLVPTYMLETQSTTNDSKGNPVTTTNWAMTPGAPIIIPEYVTADGRQRRKAQAYPLVQCFYGSSPTQVAQLARYDIEDSREFGPISLPLKLRWMGYKPGDVVTLDIPEAGLNGQDVLILNRSLEPGTGIVTITARSETAGKHAYALGQTTTPPPSPSIHPPTYGAPAPDAGDWAISATSLTSASGTVPALVLTLGADRAVEDGVDGVIFEYRVHVDGQADGDGWSGAGIEPVNVTRKEITSVSANVSYDAAVSYRSGVNTSARLIITGATTAAQVSSSDVAQLITNSKPDASFVPTADVSAGTTNAYITIPKHNRIYQDKTVAVNAGAIGPLAVSTYYVLFYDDPSRAGGAVTFQASTNPDDAVPATTAHPGRHYLGYITTPAAGSTGGSSGGGGGGGGGINNGPGGHLNSD